MINILSKIANGVKNHQRDIILGFCIILISTISFNLGKINALHKTPLSITENQNQKANIYSASNIKTNTASKQNTTPLDKRVVASKASTTKKYHFTWCPGTKQIKETNKLWFDNESLAQKAGYTLAGNCQ